MRVLRELVGMPLRENAMSLIDEPYEREGVMSLFDEAYDITRQCYPQLNIPERPIDAVPKRQFTPFTQTKKMVVDMGDLGEQECSVVFLTQPEGIEITAVTWRGMNITGDLLDGVIEGLAEEIVGLL